jgi:membrane-associated phospholipid phosphatase
VERWVELHRTSTLDTWTDLGSIMGGTGTILAVAGLAIIVLLIRRLWYDAAFVGLALFIEFSAFLSTTTIVDRPRPSITPLDPIPVTSSFPSGHTGAAIVTYIALAIVISSHLRATALRVAVWIIAALLPIYVGLSRVYRGMHHPTDVMASVVLGTSLVFGGSEFRVPAGAPPAVERDAAAAVRRVLASRLESHAQHQHFFARGWIYRLRKLQCCSGGRRQAGRSSAATVSNMGRGSSAGWVDVGGRDQRLERHRRSEQAVRARRSPAPPDLSRALPDRPITVRPPQTVGPVSTMGLFALLFGLLIGAAFWLGPDLARDWRTEGEVTKADGARIEDARCRSRLMLFTVCDVTFVDGRAAYAARHTLWYFFIDRVEREGIVLVRPKSGDAGPPACARHSTASAWSGRAGHRRATPHASSWPATRSPTSGSTSTRTRQPARWSWP